ncbi:hypothetical protein D3Y57_06930 [Sphingomonas paeninsulae]|uniref:Uncharacterized protein n=1 Tax=Sphingomonas paeninsulae TaxID=2319844 RepID=A0A494TJ02_SPHPE|nr:hypothetical protein D3Y57_06930 [Sphingomonas paeninsulae]
MLGLHVLGELLHRAVAAGTDTRFHAISDAGGLTFVSDGRAFGGFSPVAFVFHGIVKLGFALF